MQKSVLTPDETFRLLRMMGRYDPAILKPRPLRDQYCAAELDLKTVLTPEVTHVRNPNNDCSECHQRSPKEPLEMAQLPDAVHNNALGLLPGL